MSPLWFFLAVAGLGLELLVIAAMRCSAAYRRYPLVFAYCMTLFLTAVVESAAALAPTRLAFHASEQYRVFYWVNENILQFATFLLMINLIHRALEGVPTRGRFCIGLSALVLLIAIVALQVSHNGNNSGWRWMTGFSRNLSFLSALLNFVLWSVLTRQRRRDSQLLLISAGLGLMTTGKAIGHSLRSPAVSAVATGNLVIVLSSLFCLFLWWWSFRRWRPAQVRVVPDPWLRYTPQQ